MLLVQLLLLLQGRREEGHGWSQSIKTPACLVQEKYPFCIGKNVNTVTKSREKQQATALLLLTCHRERGFDDLTWK